MDDYKDIVIHIVVPIIVAIVASGLIQYFVTRYDNKNGMKKELKNISDELAEFKAVLARTHILRFADELKSGVMHSEEYFKQQILDIDTYNEYCRHHEDFANGLTKMSSEYIMLEYKRLYLSRDKKEETR